MTPLILHLLLPATPPLSFPADEGRHPEAVTELWTLHGFMQDRDGKSYSVAGIMFDGRWWLLSGQLVSVGLTDDARGSLHVGGRLFPPLLGDVEHAEGHLDERFGSSRFLRVPRRGVAVRMETKEVGFDLRVSGGLPASGLCGSGAAGWADRKVRGYVIAGARANGVLRFGARAVAVRGTVRLDHFWSNGMSHDHDFVTATLDDGSELTLLNVHDRAGQAGLRGTCATITKADGSVLTLSNLRLEVRKKWVSPRTGAEYPVDIELRATSPEVSLRFSALSQDQEASVLGVNAYHGRCAAAGTVSGAPIRGACFLMLTGYDD